MADDSSDWKCPARGSSDAQTNNIVFTPLPPLSWEKSKAAESARRLADYVACEAEGAIVWYLEKKGAKKLWAQWLRVIAILATALAGLIPLLAEADIIPGLDAIMGSVALIVAATAVALDRFFGFSTAWMRFLTTEMEIRRALHRFLLDWEATQAELAGGELDPATTQTLIQRCRDFLDEVNRILLNEMDEWVKEFRQNLAEIDKAAKAEARSAGLAALNLSVTNGDECEDGWQVSLDDRAPSKHTGKSAAFRGLAPGTHVVRVSGTVSGTTRRAERPFAAGEGRIAEISLTLE